MRHLFHLALIALLAGAAPAFANLDSPRAIDSMIHAPNEFVLGMNVDDEWKNHDEVFARIDRKLQGYFDFVTRGPLTKVNPQGKPVAIQISLKHKPDAKAKRFLDAKRKEVLAKKLKFKLQSPQ